MLLIRGGSTSRSSSRSSKGEGGRVEEEDEDEDELEVVLDVFDPTQERGEKGGEEEEKVLFVVGPMGTVGAGSSDKKARRMKTEASGGTRKAMAGAGRHHRLGGLAPEEHVTESSQEGVEGSEEGEEDAAVAGAAAMAAAAVDGHNNRVRMYVLSGVSLNLPSKSGDC